MRKKKIGLLRPYYWVTTQSLYGTLCSLGPQPEGEGWRIHFRRRLGQRGAFVGWDHDRGRWVCRSGYDLGPKRRMVGGTWWSRHWYNMHKRRSVKRGGGW